MRIEYLEKVFKEARKEGLDVCVELTIPGQEETEFIINKNSSIENKLEYYKNTYNEKGVHKNCSSIQIVHVTKINFKQKSKVHNLKIDPIYFKQQIAKKKPYEIRFNDRDFKIGDVLCLEEYDQNYTGKFIHVEIISILDNASFLQPGYICMGTTLRLDMPAKLI